MMFRNPCVFLVLIAVAVIQRASAFHIISGGGSISGCARKTARTRGSVRVRQRRNKRLTTITALGSSNNSIDDDEISKLIGKRSQIKRKKQEEIYEQKPIEPVVDIDLDKLPEFQTERPVRRAKPKDDETEEESSTSKEAYSSPIIDYMVEYEDENEFHIPNRIGVSTVAWGDPTRNFVASGKLTKRMIKLGKFVPGDLQLAHTKLLEGGILLFETAPTYGAASRKQDLSAQDMLQRFMQEQGEDLPETMVLDNLGTSAWSKVIRPSNAMLQSLEDSLARMGTPVVELFQVPKSFLFPSTLIANALTAAIESGQCNYVGVQGITRAGSLKRLRRKLEARDVALTSNSFDFSLTNPRHENMIDICKENNVIPLITNPLDGGLASGVYTATNPSGGQVSAGGATKFSFKQLEKLQPLHSVQETLSERVRTRVFREMRDMQERYKSRYGPPPQINTDITTTQIALNYIVSKGGVPLVEVNSPKQADEVLGCLGWTLTDAEIDMLDNAAALCKL